MESTALQINIQKVLAILTKDIYDSPLALLRENVQNAYDAILMRRQAEPVFQSGRIDVNISGREIIIRDNGIGMSYENLSKNYWSTGCSGKNNEEARNAGVVGTFGIGAMANFGVCSRLEVVSRKIGGDTPIIRSYVNRDDISTVEKCIQYDEVDQSELVDYGTIVCGTLSAEYSISENAAIAYLKPYVQYIQIPIYVNGQLLSMEKYGQMDEIKGIDINIENDWIDNRYEFHYKVIINRNNNQKVCQQILISHVKEMGKEIAGEIWLSSEATSLYGYRNSFGLAPIPADSIFHFGGVANMVNLTPTAGRDAVSRESIQFVIKIIEYATKLVADALSGSTMADDSREFLSYIRLSNRINLAGHITIGTPNMPNQYELRDVAPTMYGKGVMYYLGSEKSIISNFTDQNTILLIPSSDSVRRYIQVQWLKSKNIQQVPDDVMITNAVEDSTDLSLDEFALKYKIESIIEGDYLMPKVKVIHADISHGLSVVVKYDKQVLKIYLKRNAEDINRLQNIRANDYIMFEPLVKDYVRTILYPKFAEYLPSSKKMGAEALYRILQQKKELYTIESEEQGNMELVMGDYLRGEATMVDVLKAAQKARASQRQVVGSNNVGNISEIVGELSPAISALLHGHKQDDEPKYEALPPLIVDKETEYKVLRVEQSSQNLHGYHSFLAVSDKMYKENKDFFLSAHTTKVIWSTHKIIYIFTHASGGLTLYYDIDLNEPLSDNSTGGKAIETCTIIARNRIFIPIISEMTQYFDVTQRQLKFYVRFDTIRNA